MTSATITPPAKPRTLPKGRHYSAEERNEALERLREWCPPGSTVYTILRHVSSSGMSRRITLCVFLPAKASDADQAPQVYYLDGNAEKVMDKPRPPKGDGMKVGGCGMDMGYHLVSSLSSILYPDGGQDPRTGKWETGGYVLRHRWL